MTIFDFNVSLSNPQDQKLIYEIGKEMKFNIEQKGRKSNGDLSLIKLLRLPATMASGISTNFYHLILMNYLIEKKDYYKRNKPEIFLK